MQPDQPQPHEYEPAFNLLLRHFDERERGRRIARAVELIRQGAIDPHGLFVLREGTRLVGAIMCEPVAGAAGLLWPPIVVDCSPELEDLLVVHAVAWIRQQGARLGQCLMPPDDAYLARPLLRHGFDRVTTLAYLFIDRFPSSTSPARSGSWPLTFGTYDPARPGEFHEALTSSYSETLDCPEVNGVRTVEEVVQGHQAQGFDPQRWWLARQEGKPVGVLITSAEADGESWDLGYMGVVPSARRRGYGEEMLHKVFHEASAAGAGRITLCVDERNTPACRLYERMGFQVCDHRAVFLAIWQRGP
jgi:ribosomal protein S18 acetylase RimI-like enzyme